MRKKILGFFLIFLIGILFVCIWFGTMYLPHNAYLLSALPDLTMTSKITLPTAEIFAYRKIPSSVLEKMMGNSIPDKGTVDISKLSYLTIIYWGFDEKAHIGEMIVHTGLAQEVLDIFVEVYDQQYPIEKMKLIDEYGANDELSMADNNTSAFCYRAVANTNKLSKHSTGRAIDINPLYNPYVVKNAVLPVNSESYLDRELSQKGMIHQGDALYNAFIKRGWTWGGNWATQKDYQHFDKR